jgi:transposase-like protein
MPLKASLDHSTHFRALYYLERWYWRDGVICPYCKGFHVSTHHTVKTSRWQCIPCKKSFTVTVGTIFHKSQLPLNMWLYMIDLITTKPNVSAYQLARDLGINKNSCLRAAKLIRKALKNHEFPFIYKFVRNNDVDIGPMPDLVGGKIPKYTTKRILELYKKLKLE